ncbi:type II toxin-antitoxin system RelE/ParE family toxin [Pantoea sp.]|uniref:type II toxin-antitoxin system RelE family toxin n=1 Tax=Pantoea sp. TaxID=69393 RepID=UPI00289CEDD8|nr:type II toxin-antitoxin system RelE/ParE family toxin [Pantoea sp.]
MFVKPVAIQLKLDKVIQQQFAKKLKKCCKNLHIPSAKLRGIKECYKIKLRASSFRLVYQVMDAQLIIAVGKRERSDVYHLASVRLRWAVGFSWRLVLS